MNTADRIRTAAVGIAVGLVLADSSIAVLALPAIRRDFDVELADLAWVLVSFNLTLALVAIPAARFARRVGAAHTAAAGLALFALASAGCALAPSYSLLLSWRCVQAVGGAAAVVASLALLPGIVRSERRAVTVWVIAGAAGAALGPALGGILTEAVSWRAVFAAQIPIALVTLPGLIGLRPVPQTGPASRPRVAPNVGLALLSAGLAAALFLVVLLLVEGWRMSPIAAAAVVSALPLAAFATLPVSRRIPNPGARIVAGTALAAGGLAALGLLPRAGWAWTVPPQMLVGAGLALALAALTEAALEGRTPLVLHGGVTIAARHAGVVLGLLLLTPVLVGDLDRQRQAAEEAGTAALLDSPLSAARKVELGVVLAGKLEASSGQIPELGATVRAIHASPAERPALGRLAASLDDVLDRALTSSFSHSFLLAALLALGGLAAIAARPRPASAGRGSLVAVGAAAAIVLPALYAGLGGGRFEPPRTANPCETRPFQQPRTTDALAQQLAIAALDGASCELGVSREELTLALASSAERARFARAHGLDAAGVETAVRAGVVRAVDTAEHAKAINRSTALVLRGIAENLPLEALIADLGLD